MSATFQHALIMAAGRGTRMMPLTESIPKPMAPYLDSTLIASGIRQLRRHIPHVHITVGYKGAMLAEHVIGEGVASVLNTSGHGNAWWIYHTLVASIDGPLLVLTCDNVVELAFDELEAEYERVGRPSCMLVPVKPVAGLAGDYLELDGDVVTTLDRNRVSDRYCSGIQVINPARIAASTAPHDDFNDVWRELIARRDVRAARMYTGRWFAVDTVAHLESLNLEWRSGARVV